MTVARETRAPPCARALKAMARRLAISPGLAGKSDVGQVVTALGLNDRHAACRVGDDTASIASCAGGGWNLLACEGMLPSFIGAMPWFAGFCAVWVNVSDVLAMGGRPTAIVNALWSPDSVSARPVLDGMREAAQIVGVPIVGGHANLQAPGLNLSVSILGFTNHLLTSFDAVPGDRLVMVADLRGRSHAPWPFWDAASEAPPMRLRGDLELLPTLAEAGLSKAAKDISQGGVIGTAAMFAEASGVGMTIDLDAVPVPEDQSLEPWMCTFPSFGYLLAVGAANVAPVQTHFRARDIAVADIGEVNDSRQLMISRAGHRALVRDLAAEPLTHC